MFSLSSSSPKFFLFGVSTVTFHHISDFSQFSALAIAWGALAQLCSFAISIPLIISLRSQLIESQDVSPGMKDSLSVNHIFKKL